MEILTIIFLVVILIPTIVYIFRPLQESTSFRGDSNPARILLLEDKDRLLALLRELDFDHLLGKVPEDEYTNQRANLLHLGANVLKELDSLQIAVSHVAYPPSSIEGKAKTDKDLEDYIQKRRLKHSKKTK